MRFLKTTLLAVLVLLLGVSSASAFAYHISARNSTGPLQPGDTVTVDVFFDADQVGINFFSLAVLFDSTFLQYDQAASPLLPVIYPAPAPAYGTTGAEAGYILYSPQEGTGMTALPAVYLYPAQTPAWFTWPNPPATKNQVNINWLETNITDTFHTRATGSNIWIGSLVLRVRQTAPNGDALVSLCNTCGGNVFQLGDVVLPANMIPMTGNFTVTVPEPTTMALGVAALASVGICGYGLRRRREG